jgi:hypothetical protein
MMSKKKSPPVVSRRQAAVGFGAAALFPLSAYSDAVSDKGTLWVTVGKKVAIPAIAGGITELKKSILADVKIEWKPSLASVDLSESIGFIFIKRVFKALDDDDKEDNKAKGIAIYRILPGKDGSQAKVSVRDPVLLTSMSSYREIFGPEENRVTGEGATRLVGKAFSYLNLIHEERPLSVLGASKPLELPGVREFFLDKSIFQPAHGRMAHAFEFTKSASRPYWKFDARGSNITEITTRVGVFFDGELITYSLVQKNG